MELLRYLLVFLVVGWGAGLLGLVLFAVLMALLPQLRGTNIGRAMVAAGNGIAVFLAVLLAAQICEWTGGGPKWAMFVIAFIAMLMNDFWRVERMKTAPVFGGQIVDDEEGLRANLVLTERLNAVGDVVGFTAAVWILRPMSIL